jgi:PAS domain S-box-containing protein
MTESTIKSESSLLVPTQLNKRILVVDDNIGDFYLVKELLKETDFRNYHLEHKENLKEGLEVVKSEPSFDLILLDLSLPDSQGLSTVSAMAHSAGDTPIVVFTGSDDKVLSNKALKAGAQDFLVKNALSYDRLDIIERVLMFAIERKRAEIQINQTRAQYQNIFMNSKDAIFISSPEGFLSDFNEATMGLFGVSKEKLQNISINSYFNPETKFKNWLDAISAGFPSQDEELHLEREDGTIREVLLTGISLSSKSGHYSAIIRDVTEKKQAEELRISRDLAFESSRMKEQFIASISHEMRTPMNAILGMSNLLIGTPMNEEQLGLMKSIKQSSEILLGVVNDILEISTIQNGKLSFELKPFNLHELMANLVNVMQYKIAEKQLSFELSMETDVPEWVVGDKLRLNQILYNLVGNAIKFTDEGSVTIHLKAEESEKENWLLRFEINDSGIGIPKDKLESIFDSFTRVKYKDRLFEGTGLGLSISKNLVVQQDGKVWAESEIGKGSTFIVELSFGKYKEEEVVLLNPALTTGNPNLCLPYAEIAFDLLIAEDNKMNQVVVKKTIEKAFPLCNIKIVENGLLALEILKERPFDLVLMDIQMPVMDGNESATAIRKELPDYSSMAILAMTAHAYISKTKEYIQYGMQDFVLKPFDPEQLFEKIVQYLPESKKYKRV